MTKFETFVRLKQNDALDLNYYSVCGEDDRKKNSA